MPILLITLPADVPYPLIVPPTGCPTLLPVGGFFLIVNNLLVNYQNWLGVDTLGKESTFTYEMRCFVWVGLFVEFVFLTGCTAVMDKLSTNYYERNYSAQIPVEELNPKAQPQPSVQNALMPHHGERVKMHLDGGWEVLGISEFNTSGSPRHNHLLKLARKLGSKLVVYSQKFDRREQELVKRSEYQQGERITVNGTTVEMEGRWVDVIDVVTRTYHDFRVTFLRDVRE